MREPRLFRNPNGGLLSLDVTLLQIGLSRCRCIAEDTLAKMARRDEVDYEGIFNEILDEARKTMSGIADEDMENEVGALLRSEKEKHEGV